MFTFATDFESAAIAAAKTMTGNVADLPDCHGMVLVRAGTAESEERQTRAGILMIPFSSEGQTYWICSG